jgi:hypothetical protein
MARVTETTERETTGKGKLLCYQTHSLLLSLIVCQPQIIILIVQSNIIDLVRN